MAKDVNTQVLEFTPPREEAMTLSYQLRNLQVIDCICRSMITHSHTTSSHTRCLSIFTSKRSCKMPRLGRVSACETTLGVIDPNRLRLTRWPKCLKTAETEGTPHVRVRASECEWASGHCSCLKLCLCEWEKEMTKTSNALSRTIKYSFFLYFSTFLKIKSTLL